MRTNTVVEGIIPACAGNTVSPLGYYRLYWDHPRVCGEHSDTALDIIYQEGSSPRVRGTPKAVPPRRIYGGIIPACAGNTLYIGAKSSEKRDHPRVCGEHS